MPWIFYPLLVETDALKRLQAETVAELDELLPSILDKAFGGRIMMSAQAAFLLQPLALIFHPSTARLPALLERAFKGEL